MTPAKITRLQNHLARMQAFEWSFPTRVNRAHTDRAARALREALCPEALPVPHTPTLSGIPMPANDVCWSQCG